MKNRIFNKRVLSFLLTLLMIVGVFPAGAFAVSANEETQPVAESTAVAKVGNTEYATVDDAVSAAQAGDTITILAAVAGVEVAISKDITLDLGGKTITDAYIQIAANVTIKNGSIKNTNESYPLVVNSGALTVKNVAIEASKSDRTIWLKNSGTVLNFNSGSILATKGENNIYSKIYGVWVSQGATANINGGTIEVDAGADATAVAIFGNYVNTVNITGGKISTSGKTYSYAVWTDGGVTVTGGEIVTNKKGYGYSSGITYGKNYAINTKGDVKITGGKITTNGPSGYLVNAGGSNQTVTISDVEFTNVLSEADKTAGGHSEPNLIYGSSVNATITGGEFEGVNKTLIKGTNSTLTVSGGTFDVDVSEYLAEDVKMEQNADGSYGVKTEPKGNNFTGYTSTDGIWGEVWGNATESFVIKVLDANDNVMGTTSLNNVGGIIDGDVNVSWNLKLDAASNTDEYWTMSWTTAPTINNMPAKVELWVDGVKVSGGPVVLHGPDEINKIVAAVADSEGKILNYATSLQTAIDAGKTTVVLTDVTESITSLKGNIVSGIESGVTITGTSDDWVYCGDNFTIGEGVTFKTAYMFAYCKNGVINGKVVLSGQLYMRYAGTKLTVNAPGSLVITGENAIVRYMDGDAEAGLYINGDNDDTTVEFKAPYISFYSGIISAKDAVVETGVLWMTNSNDSAEHGMAYLKLDNTKLNMTVNEHTFKADDNSKIELVNGSEMNIAGKYQVADSVVLSVDNTSSITAQDFTYVHPVAQIVEETYTSLEAAFAAAAEGDTITLLADAAPALTSQRAITKASVIDLNGKTLTLTEDDLYFGTTTFMNGTIVVDPSVKASTAVFWMFENQTLTFNNVKIVATGVTGTYLIGINGGSGTKVNLINNSAIIIENTATAGLTAVICDNGTDNTVVIEKSTINVANIEGRFYLGGKNGTVTVEDSAVTLKGVKEGFYLRAGQTLSIKGDSEVNIALNDTNGRYGINVTDATAIYIKDDRSVVNTTVYVHKAGTITPAFTGTNTIWGEGSGNASESLAVKLYSGETLLVTATLNDPDKVILDGNVEGITWNIPLNGKGNDSWWNIVWDNYITADLQPTKVVMVIDGVEVAENNYQLNGPDDLNKIVAASADAAGKITGYYTSLNAALAALNAGDTIVLFSDVNGNLELPADVILAGNGKQITGTLYLKGNVTFNGYVKANAFDFENVGTEINIPVGATLELTGTGRMVIGHGCTFNIIGTITDAKTANVADITPSLIMPGASFTGAGVTFNVTNAYIKAPSSYCSSSKSASGTFDFNITNSIVETAGKLAFEAQSTAATVNFELKDSVLTTGSHLVFGVSRGEIVIDNSNVNVGKSNQIENQSTMTIKNGSVVNGAVATNSNAKNPGTVIVDNATYAVTGEFSGSDLGTGTLIVKNGATVSAGSITNANIQIDATGMSAGELANFTANLSKFTGTVEVINNDKLEAKIVDGKIMLVGCVAKIGEKKFESLADALAAAKDGETITLLWAEGDAPIAMNGAVYGKSVTITGTATVDWSKGFLFVGRGGEGNGTVTFENANLTSASNSASYGIHVSGREKDTNNKYDGTLIIKNSTIVLDYLINKGTITLDNSTLTVKNGFAIGGRPASETETGVDATATLDLTNGSKVVVNNHNGMGLGYEAIGVMNVDASSTFETTQSFLVTAKGTMNIAGTAKVAGTLTNNGSIVLTAVDATLTSSECGNVTTDLADHKVEYADGIWTVVAEILGDISGDREVDVKDVILLRKYIVGLVGETEINKSVADLNEDGIINVLDVVLLRLLIADNN